MTETLPLHDFTALVRGKLERVNRELVLDLTPGHREMAPLVERAAAYRGKQLRPALVFLSGMAARGMAHAEALPDALLQVAKVVELLHTATLVHDDVLDGATVRRRIATVNAMSGVEVAVLLGDYVYARAFHMAVQLEDPTCARWLSETVRVICQGEITQILHRLDFAWTEEHYFRVIAEKTASLYAAACRLGAHYAGASPARLEALQTFGLELGIAFQIVDDCLDLDGDESVVGKSLGTDLARGKLTLPLLWIAAREPSAAGRLRALMDGEPAVAVRRLKASFPLADAVAYAMDEARRRVQRARACLDVLPDGPAREALHEVAAFVVARRA